MPWVALVRRGESSNDRRVSRDSHRKSGRTWGGTIPFSERPDLIKRTLSSEVSHRDESIELSIVSEDKS